MSSGSGNLTFLAVATGGGGATCLAGSLALLAGRPQGHPAVLPLFLAACVCLGVAAAAAGLLLARQLLGRPLNRRAAERLDLRTDLPPDPVRRARGDLEGAGTELEHAATDSARIVDSIFDAVGAVDDDPPPGRRRFGIFR